MFATTTVETNIPFVLYDYDQKAEIRSINEVFSEYTINNVSNYRNDIREIFIKLFIENNGNSKLDTTSINDVLGDVMSKYYVTKNKIEILDHIYEFQTEFIYSISRQQDGYIAENEYFNIYGFGDTIEEAQEELYIYINDLWEGYVEESDENLDESAKELKNKLLNNIRKIK